MIYSRSRILDIVFVDQEAEWMIVIVQMMKDDAKYIIVSALIRS